MGEVAQFFGLAADGAPKAPGDPETAEGSKLPDKSR
jgi:hypothetical protein